jgi:deoxyribonuclease V
MGLSSILSIIGERGEEATMHEWNVTPDEAVAIQEQWRTRVIADDTIDLAAIRTVAGIDVQYREVGRAAVVVLALPDLRVVDQATAEQAVAFPYIPGLFSFREVPVVLAALAKLTVQPDVLMCDGYGYAHPRRFGLACHLGVLLDRPALGCAKSRFIGTYAEPGPALGDQAPLRDDGEVIGMAVRTRPGTKPIYVSLGHRLSLDTAVALTLHCLAGYRVPEPTRLADIVAAKA